MKIYSSSAVIGNMCLAEGVVDLSGNCTLDVAISSSVLFTNVMSLTAVLYHLHIIKTDAKRGIDDRNRCWISV